MSSRRVDLRITRKARPASDLISSPPLSSRTRSETRLSKRNTKKKVPKPKQETVGSKPEQTPLSSDLQLKSRRRRADASDYIRRRFLYDDNDDAAEKVAKSRSVKSQKRNSHETKFQNSPLALMAASSANYQKKRRKMNVASPPIHSGSPRSRRGRRPKVLSPPTDEYSEDNMSGYDMGSSDGEFSDEFGSKIPESYSHRRSRIEHDENSHLIKPMFRKVVKKEPYKTGDYRSDSHQEYESNIPELMFDDCMSDFTRRRGPLALSKRARHRIIPRSSATRNDELKEMPDYPEGEFTDFGLADSDPDFRHQVRGNFSLDHGISLEDSNRVDVNAWSGHMGESDDPNSLNPLKSSVAVDIEDFAGDLLPQSSASSTYPPVSGSSRRKSPVRPMQVLRNETAFYPENGQGGANLIQQKIAYPSFSQSSSVVEPVSTAAAGLVDLCAAAVLDSNALTSSQVSQPATQTPVSSVHSSQPIISNAAQYSLINPGLVGLQPGGRVFVDARTPITGYTVTSTPPMSKISLMSGRVSYGQPQNITRITHSAGGGKATATSVVSSSSGPSNSSANSGSRRRPTILKRKELPPVSTSPAPAPKISPVQRPSPPFMRTALRSMQTSPLMSTLQRSVRPLAYTIVSAPGQAGMFTVTPTSNLQSTPPTSQTASSRLFGTKRTLAPTATTEVRPVGSVAASSNVALFSCLPPSSIVTPAQNPMRYTLVQDASAQEKFYILGGDTNAGVVGTKRPLQSIEPVNKEGVSECVQANLTDFSKGQEAASSDAAASNQNLPP